MAARRVGVALDSSAGSRYALEWALKNIVKEGDHLVLIIVNKKVIEEVGEVLLWQDTGSPMVPLANFKDPATATKYGVTPEPQIVALLESEAGEKQLWVAFKIYWGDARERICDAVVDLPLDCIVMGSRGLGKLKRAMLGSVSNYVVNNAPCPVTVVKLPADISASDGYAK